MRNLFLFLLLSNLGFAAWSHWFRETPAASYASRDAATPSITLLSELDAAARRAVRELDVPASPPLPEPQTERLPEPEPLAAAAEPTVERCLSIGPFEELAQAAAAGVGLRSAGYSPNQRVVEGDIWVGYWVYLPDIPTRDEASEILTRLRENDISDSYIVPGGEESHIISLGVFSEISRAGTVREQVRRLGYDPTVADRSRRGTLYWIDVVLGPGDEIDMGTLQAPGRINRLEQRRCVNATR